MARKPKLDLSLPGNQRYQPQELKEIFGYDRLYLGLAKVEIAALEVLHEIGVIADEEILLLTPAAKRKLCLIRTTEVDGVERKFTKHDVRAWVRIAQEILDPHIGRWLHVPMTSYDPLDSGRAWQFMQAYQLALRPALNEVIILFIERIRELAEQAQIGRTHGQHALPITIGFWLATLLYRIIYNTEKLHLHAHELVGKISGPVGAYNAQKHLGILRLCGSKTFEMRVLEKIGLKPAPISTQIAPPDPLGYFLTSVAFLTENIAQFGRDCRQLMRPEIGEVKEIKELGAVGSSSMPHKTNPISYENCEGMWSKTIGQLVVFFTTMISEHQRDLVNSGPARDFPVILVNLQHQLGTLRRKDRQTQTPFIKRILIDAEACNRNLDMNAHLVLSEPLYIALLIGGYAGDTHKLLNDVLVPRAHEEHRLLVDVLLDQAESDEQLSEAVSQIPPDILELFRHPKTYVGSAPEQALKIADAAERFTATLTT
jgi:adenylosuccinate lyase